MADQPAEKPCCRRTRARWMRRILAHFASYPVIKDVPCDECWRSSRSGSTTARGLIAVVISVLDEERRVGARLAELRPTPGLHELIVVDGGSADRTLAIAHDAAYASSPRRGRYTAGPRRPPTDLADVHSGA